MAVGNGGLLSEEDMPQRPCGDEKVGAPIPCDVGALHTNRCGGKQKMRDPSRLPNRTPGTTTITWAQVVAAGMNAQPPSAGEAAIKRCPNESATVIRKQRMPDRAESAKKNLFKGSSGEMPQKHQAELDIEASHLRRHPPGIHVQGASDGATQLVAIEEEQSKSKSLFQRKSRAVSQQLRTTGSSIRPSARNGRPLDGNNTAKDRKEPCAKQSTITRVPKRNDLQEANDEIRRLNELGLGEDISPDQYLEFVDKLPDDPVVNTYIKLSYDQMIPLYIRHARYRIRYYKSSIRTSTDRQNCAVGLLEKEDFPEEFLRKNGYFVNFERDGTFDWSFDPDLCKIRDLDDYQLLVPHDDVGGDNYPDWDKYRTSFHSYEAEQEYLNYCSELSKQLKWMEDYAMIESPSLKWGMINTRGAFQAMKIATTFSRITPFLAVTGFHEFVHKICFDAFWVKSTSDFYFEIWILVTKQKKSMKCALEELYKLNKFPMMVFRLLNALEYGYRDTEMQFHTYTKNVPSGVTEDVAHSLIAEAVNKLIRRPKLYEDYIRKKIAIAQTIGLISTATGGMSLREHLIKERASIRDSVNQIDEVINQAQSTRVAIFNQRALFGDVQGKVKQLGENFPIFRGLLGADKLKKSKDTVILSAVMAACTVFWIIYWLSK